MNRTERIERIERQIANTFFIEILVAGISWYISQFLSVCIFYIILHNIIICFNRKNPRHNNWRIFTETTDKDCVICFDHFNDSKRIILIHTCNNIFHKKCIKKWYKRKRMCPFCNTF
jgi:hypothetical protein